jgi:hypothetical protein
MNDIENQVRRVELAPPITGAALLHLDGQCFTANYGTLAIALSESALRGQLRLGRPTHWLLPLEAPWIAQYLPQLEGEILWVSSRPPRAVVGALNENIRGAWIDGDRAVLSLGELERELLVKQMPSAPFVVSYLARLVVDSWTGREYSHVTVDPSACASSNSYQFAA